MLGKFFSKVVVLSSAIALPLFCDAAGIWSTGPSMSARLAPAAAAINGIFYVAGGNDGISDSSTLQAYNPASNTWTTLASMPGGRYEGDGAGVINGKLYIPGGWTTSPGLPHSELFVYDPATNSWSSAASLSSLSACGTSTVINNIMYTTTTCNGPSGFAI